MAFGEPLRADVAHSDVLESLGVVINVCGALSLAGSAVVLAVIAYHGLARSRVALKAIPHITAATLG